MPTMVGLVEAINRVMHACYSSETRKVASVPLPAMSILMQRIGEVMEVSTLGKIRTASATVCPWSPLSVPDIERMCDHRLMEECYNAVHMADMGGAPGELPLCSYTHDVSQLMFARTSKTGVPAPVCCNSVSHGCCVDSLPCPNVETLKSLYAKAQVFLTPEQEMTFQATGQAPEGPCLMCIRRDVSKMVYQLQGAHSPESLVHRPKIVLPFTNQHGCHGGYRTDAILQTPLVTGLIVRFDNDFKVNTVISIAMAATCAILCTHLTWCVRHTGNIQRGNKSMGCRTVPSHVHARARPSFKLTSGTFACPAVETIVHRLRFLIPNYKSGYISKKNAGLLFGPLAVWIESDCSSIPVVDPSDGGKVDQRIHALYRVYQLYNDIVPPEAMLPYYIGILIDLHIHARPYTTVKEMAINKVLPEQLSIDTVLNDERSGLGAQDVHSIWSSCSGIVQCKSFIPWAPNNPFEEIRPKSKIRHVKRFPLNSEVMDSPPQPKPAPVSVNALFNHCIMGTQEPRYIKRSVVPYIMDGNTRYTTIVCRGLLGAYRLARTIAPPDMRLATYEKFDAARFVETTKPDVLTYLIREYVFSASKHHAIAWSLLQSDEAFRTTFDTTRRFMDSVRAGDSLPTSVHRLPTRHVTAIEIIDFLCESMKIDDTAAPQSLNRIVSGGVSLRWFFVLARMQKGDMRIYDGALESIGVPEADRAAIRDAVCSPTVAAAREAIRTLTLSPVGLAKFRHYIYILVQGSRVGYRRAIRCTEPGSGPVYAVICRRCNSLLSNYVLGQLQAATCELDTFASTARCSVCLYQSLLQVDITTNVVYTRAASPKYMSILTVCNLCHAPCAWHSDLYFKNKQYCVKCFHAVATQTIITTCLCGRAVKKNTPRFVTDSGHYILCKSHTWLTRYKQGYSMPFYRALISQ